MGSIPRGYGKCLGKWLTMDGLNFEGLLTHEGFQSLFILFDQSVELLVIVLQTVIFFGHCSIHSL